MVVGNDQLLHMTSYWVFCGFRQLVMGMKHKRCTPWVGEGGRRFAIAQEACTRGGNLRYFGKCERKEESSMGARLLVAKPAFDTTGFVSLRCARG